MARKRTAYHHGNLRQVFLRAALRMAEREGVGSLSMRELARRVGVSHGAPYHHFADRTSLLAAVAEEGFVLLARAMSDALVIAGKDPRARFEACGRGYVAFALEHRAHFRIMFRPELIDPEHYPAVDAQSQAALQLLTTIVDDCQRAGLARHVEAKALVLTAWSTAHGFASLCVDGPLARGLRNFPGDPSVLAVGVSRTLGALLEPD
jgi:AcrR family transcriptional regulator